MTVLQGSLETFALPDVFRLLAENQVTGALKVARESGEGMVYFREGEVYYSFSSLTREFLGQRLVNAKLITQGQLLRALDEQKKLERVRLGDLLVEKGYISDELLNTFLKEQIQDSIFNLLQWDRGTFSFENDVVSPQEVGLSVSVENLIMESSRRIEEWEVIRRKIPNMDVVLRMAPTPPDDMEINIKPEEWKLMVLADGKRTVRDISAAAERSEFDTAKILYGLITAGLLDVSTSPSSAATQTELPSMVSTPMVSTPAVSPPTVSPPTVSPPAVSPPATPQTEAPQEPAYDQTEEPETAEELVEDSPDAAPVLPPQAVADEPAPSEPTADVPVEPLEVVGGPAQDESSDEAVAMATPGTETQGEVTDAGASQESGSVEVVSEEQGDGKLEEVSVAASGNGAASSDERKAGEQGVTKDMLLRLIEGVRNL